MEIPTFGQAWDLIKGIPDLVTNETPTPTAAQVEALKKEADAAATRLAAPKMKAAEALTQRSNAAHGRLKTWEKEWSLLKDSPGEGHRAPPEEWYKDAREAQRLDDQLSSMEKQYSGALDYFKDSISYSHYARRYLGDVVGKANTQISKVYMRSNLELTIVAGVAAYLDLKLKGMPALVVGIGQKKVEDAIKAQRGTPEKEPKDRLKDATSKVSDAGDYASKLKDSSLLKSIADKINKSGALGEAIGFGAESGGPLADLKIPGITNLKGLGLNADGALSGLKTYQDLAELQGEFDKAVPQLSLLRDDEEALDDMAKEVEGFPDSVDKNAIKGAINNVKEGQEDVKKSTEYLIAATEALAQAIEMAEKFKVSWSKPK